MQRLGFNIYNRRYIGSKAKLVNWIFDNIKIEGINSVCDIFAGSGVIAEKFTTIPHINNIVLNDLLYSNQIIYSAFFLGQQSDFNKLNELQHFLNYDIPLKNNYFSDNFSNKFFSFNDCLKIGTIREYINTLQLSELDRNILLASLIYSMDKIANTVGHYEAYRKSITPQDMFVFELIKPIQHNKNIQIYRTDANILAKTIKADLVFIDPPYNSRQYSRFYHIYENLIKWEKPKLYGVALKPAEENMSNYCRSNAPKFLADLIENIDCKQIILTYNNTYNSKSSSSQNKINFDEIQQILNKKGKLKIIEKIHSYFNAGKTNFNDHKEFLFIVEVKQ